MDVKHEDLSLCNACLCVGRNLYQITDEKAKQFYISALSEIPLYNALPTVPAVCYECRLLLQRAVQFKEQVKDSYRILVTYTSENLQSCLISDVSRPPRLKVKVNDNIDIQGANSFQLFEDDIINDHIMQDTESSENTNQERVPCTRRVFVKEEEMKLEPDGSDIDAIYSDIQENSIPIDILDDDIKCIIEQKTRKKVKRKHKGKVKKLSTRKDSKPPQSSENTNQERVPCTQRVFMKEEEIKLEPDDIDAIYSDSQENTIPIDILDDDIKCIIEQKTRKKVKSKRKGKVKSTRKTKNGIPDMIKIDLTLEEMAQERDKEYEKESYIKSEFKCESCIIGFTYQKSFKRHLKTKHSPDLGDYPCPICKTVLASVDAFTAHYRRHMRRFECTICQKRTIDIKVMEQHYYSSHGISLKHYKCNECGVISKSIDSHRYHTDTHKSRLQCTECDKTFRHRGGLLNHKLTVHELQNDFPCNICNKVFRWKNSLKRHLDSHESKNKIQSDAAFCVMCNISFASNSSYQRHLTNSLKHVTKDDFRFICDHCKRRFANKTKLRDHIEEKHLHKTYQCEICLKVSKNRVNLDQHIRNVHKGRPNNKICHHCGKGFPTKVQLESHIRAHTGERPFICEYCPTTFSQQSNLYKHNRQVHLNMKSKRYPLKKKKEDALPINAEMPVEYNPIELAFQM